MVEKQSILWQRRVQSIGELQMIFEIGAPLVLYSAMASGGESEAARFVATQLREGRRALCRTYTFGHAFMEALEGLASIQAQCSRPNWDGFGAEPVRQETIWAAYRFLEALPYGLPVPTVGAEPDGQITLEWHRSPRRTVSISVASDDNLHYSALFGPNKQYGTEVFFGEAPKAILDLIHRVQA
jgi:hypothetical protein